MYSLMAESCMPGGAPGGGGAGLPAPIRVAAATAAAAAAAVALLNHLCQGLFHI